MKRDVQISILGIQNDGGDEERIETAAFGEFMLLGNSYCLKYEEVSEDGDVLKTLIKISNDGMEVIKQGSTSSKMVFRKGCVTETDYETPYGVLHMSMDTSEVLFQLEEDGASVQAEYILCLNGSPVSLNRLRINVKYE